MAIAPWLLGMLILLTGLSEAENITRQRGRDGRLYFTNRAAAVSQERSASPAAAPRSQRVRIMPLVYTLARQYDIDAQLVRAIITVESNFNA